MERGIEDVLTDRALAHRLRLMVDAPRSFRRDERDALLLEGARRLERPADPKVVDDLVRVFSDAMFADEIARRLTCEEAEVIAALLRTFARTGEADEWLRAHARSDVEDTDRHHDLYLAMPAEERTR